MLILSAHIISLKYSPSENCEKAITTLLLFESLMQLKINT